MSNNKINSMAKQLSGICSTEDAKHILAALICLRQSSTKENWTEIIRESNIHEVIKLNIDKSNQSIQNLFSQISDFSIVPSNSLSKICKNLLSTDGLESDVVGQLDLAFKSHFERTIQYTPVRLTNLIFNLLPPQDGDTIYDGCCGTGRFFTEANKRADVKCLGQDIEPTAREMALTNAAIHGIDLNVGKRAADSLCDDQFPNLRASLVVSNPPFHVRIRAVSADDPRWKYGIPSTDDGDMAFLQHHLYHLSDTGYMAMIFDLACTQSIQFQQNKIRKNLIEAGVVHAVIALPKDMFDHTNMRTSIWILSKQPTDHIMMINSSAEFLPEQIINAFHNNIEIENFSKCIPLDAINPPNYSLLPSLYTYNSQPHPTYAVSSTTYRLGELICLRYSKRDPHKRASGSYPVYSSSGIYGYTDDPKENTPALIIGRKGNIGSVFFPKTDFSVSETVYIAHPIQNKIPLEYLYYKLRFMNFSHLDVGATAPYLPPESLLDTEIVIPNDFASALSMLTALDKKQILNRSLISGLETRIFDVYHRFMNRINTKQRLSGLATVTVGETSKAQGTLPWYDIRSMNSPYLAKPARLVTSKKSAIPADTLLVSYKLTQGRTTFSSTECMTNEAIAAVHPFDEDLKYYLFCALREFPYAECGTNSHIGQSMRISDFRELELPILSKNDLTDFVRQTKPLFDIIRDTVSENLKIEQQLKTLI